MTSNTLDLQESKFDRRGPAKNTYEDFHATMIRIHVIHCAVEAQERTVHNSDIVTLDKPNLLTRPCRTGVHLLQQGIDFFRRKRRRLSPPPTNPVTLGVSLIICKVSSASGASNSIKT